MRKTHPDRKFCAKMQYFPVILRHRSVFSRVEVAGTSAQTGHYMGIRSVVAGLVPARCSFAAII